jgi:hypothetical protein
MSHNGSSETSSFIDECWATWFCNLAGNQFFCEIDKAYIEDSFNLFGLKQHLPKDYSKALDAILDRLGKNKQHSLLVILCSYTKTIFLSFLLLQLQMKPR